MFSELVGKKVMCREAHVSHGKDRNEFEFIVAHGRLFVLSRCKQIPMWVRIRVSAISVCR